MTKKEQSNVTKLNQGVNYMEQGQRPMVTPEVPDQSLTVSEPSISSQSIENVQLVQPVQPVQPVQSVENVQQQVVPSQQPIINKVALKAQADNMANVAKNGVNTYIEKLKTNKAVLAGSIVGAVLIVVLVLVFLSKLLNPSYNVVNKYMSGMKNMNAEKIAKLYHKDIIEARYDGDEDDLIDNLKDEFDDMDDEDTRITGYKIRECEKYSKDELEDLAEYFEEYLDIDEKDVKAAKKYFVRVNFDVDGEKNIDYETVLVVKIGNKWSLYY